MSGTIFRLSSYVTRPLNNWPMMKCEYASLARAGSSVGGSWGSPAMLRASGLLGSGVTLADGLPDSLAPGVVGPGGLPPDDGKGQQPESTTSKASRRGSTRHLRDVTLTFL